MVRPRGIPMRQTNRALRKPRVTAHQAQLAVESFSQYLNMTIVDLAKHLNMAPIKLSQIRSGKKIVHDELALQMFRDFGLLIDWYVDEAENVPDPLKREVVEYLDALIQPFGPQGDD